MRTKEGRGPPAFVSCRAKRGSAAWESERKWLGDKSKRWEWGIRRVTAETRRGWWWREARDDGEKEPGWGRSGKKRGEDKMLLSWRQNKSPGVHWEREGGAFLNKEVTNCWGDHACVAFACVSVGLHFSALWFATGDRIVTLASVISCSSNPGTQFSWLASPSHPRLPVPSLSAHPEM